MPHPIIRQPANTVARSHHNLITPVSNVRSLHEARHKLRRLLSPLKDRDRKPLRTSDVGGGVRRNILGVDGDAAAAFLQQPSGGQPDRTASQHGYVFLIRAVYFAACQLPVPHDSVTPPPPWP